MIKGHGLALGAGALAPIALAALTFLQPAPAPQPVAAPVAAAPVPAPPPQPPAAQPASAAPTAAATPAGAAPAAAPRAAPPAPAAIAGPLPPPGAAAPASCLARFPAMPLPRQRGESAAQKAVLICRRGYALSFNPSARNPDWVMERLAAGDLSGKASRSNNFGGDPLLNSADADDDDYLRSGYDRGHQAPAGDAKFDQTIMDQSFFFSNMAPQIGIGFNRGAWKYLEETVRAWVLCGGHPDLYVVTGPIYGASTKTIGNDAVRVPESFFKIVYDPTSGRAVGFVLPNRRIGSRLDDLQAWVRPIADIETDTGLDFFRSFAKRRQTELEAHAGAAWGHVGTCASDSDD